ncbi:exosome nuclease subunit [Coemansia thaxteri]|uniref:Exosome nuclease subunit n=1 Tax=Coemansia thaxteri TaxID=2663907 RepID=A0A9W8BN46_9FUNG|nr:exosome nuclease subunit [Coemansia thaxteri]KAJ2007573.1 exosome nuclease subunit [Coemansia thaxteri]KAJ2469786.1 exosome nuclease subunit [Coemansia sp. RSA 2322]KAJ2487797.1 exosome nuclease subunit [Coemansia sp. RSA 2320]
MASKKDIPDFIGAFDSSVAVAFGALVKATKAVGKLGDDIAFHRTLDESIDTRLAAASQRTLDMANRLWMTSRVNNGRALAIEAAEDIAIRGELVGNNEQKWVAGPQFGAVVDAVDTLLERIDVGLDELAKNSAHQLRTAASAAAAANAVGTQSAAVVTSVAAGARSDVRVVHAQNMPRPQLQFADAIDNSPSTPFVWRIRTKPHAQVPLDHGLPSAAMAGSTLGRHLQTLGISRPGTPSSSSGTGTPRLRREVEAPPALDAAQLADAMTGVAAALPHPYEFEIKNYEPPTRLFAEAEPQTPCEWDATPFAFVDSEAALRAMMAHLVGAREVAIDLEHHNFRSFQGFTCLVQISTRTHDFVVDALALRGQLHMLNEVTADPRIVKVFHGAESDVVWLQRDFGVYVVGLFDTYHASHVLNMGHHSLAHLLRVFCSYDADKRYQLADWRIRPVPSEMMHYARADTHFLLYVFDRMRNDLVRRGADLVGEDVATPGAPHFGHLAGLDRVLSAAQPMQLVMQRSAQTALSVYVKESYDAAMGAGAGGWAALLRKWRQPLAPAQLAVFRALHAWRDACAREEDESTRYVLPNHMLFSLAQRMPADVPALLAACHPTPPPVRMHSADLVVLIARERHAAEHRIASHDVADEEERPRLPAPVHTRFADGEEGAADDVLTPDVKAAAAAICSPVSQLFGTLSSPTLSSAKASAAGRRAQEVRAALALTAIVPAAVVPDSKEPEFTPVEKRKRSSSDSPPPVAAEVQAHKPAQPVVLSETYAPYRPQSEPRRPAKVDNSLQLPKIALGDIDDSSSSDDHQAKKPATRRPKPSKKSSSSSKKQVPPAQVTPFDYQADPDVEVIGETAAAPSGSKKRSKKSPRSKGFDPYAQMATSKELAKKPSRSRVNQKSGNRSMTFKQA